MKKAFTLAEVLITLTVIAVLVMVLLPVLKNAMPNRSMTMFKKTFFVIERVASELVNDSDFYPDVIGGATPPYLGNIIPVTYENVEYSGDTKFCGLFGQKMNVKSNVQCTEQTFIDGEASLGQFVSVDNIAYILPINSFATAQRQSIYIDVNSTKSPNCFYNEKTCKAPDRFEIKVNRKGTLCVEGVRESQYLASNDITKKAEDYGADYNPYFCPEEVEFTPVTTPEVVTPEAPNLDDEIAALCPSGTIFVNGACHSGNGNSSGTTSGGGSANSPTYSDGGSTSSPNSNNDAEYEDENNDWCEQYKDSNGNILCIDKPVVSGEAFD